MQFVKGGPDIPEQLLQAHEDGRVVFFCGGGISYPAGLPTFAGLVTQLYAAVGIDPDPVEAGAMKAGQYDTAVGLLEARVRGGRQTVREALAHILTPNLAARNATATHQALLTLGKDRNDRTRLITTNFDRLFEEVIAATQLSLEPFRAPLFPVPKNRWDGLVYLHGLLTANPSASDLERLVVSSGDFGLAYLTERWAARFVSELLRNFVVCFVGYSINDPVLRYMMDALAADRLLGESPPEMFAFGSYSKGKKDDRARDWQAKNVTPILYREHWHHAYLHRTLHAWSKTYRDGAQGKEWIVVEHAMARPLASTEQDDFVGRLIWALSDPSGLPAKRFAELDPVPSLEWLEPLSEDRFGHVDLVRFDVSPKTTVDDNLAFSLTRRPSPYDLAPWMALVNSGADQRRWDNVMAQIARWLIRHLDDPALLLWLVKRGDVLHEGMARGIERKLVELATLERDGDRAGLERIRADAPNAIPRPAMRKLWRLLLSGRVRKWVDDLDLYPWCERFRRSGLTVILRLELREKLTPRVMLREPFPWPFDDEEDETDEPVHMSRLVEAEIVLSTKGVRPYLQELAGDERWTVALPGLLSDFTELLRDALDLMRELGYADDRTDQSYSSQPSISEHPQNHGVRDWTALIELARDSWLATCARFAAGARTAAEAWWQIPYPVFRRLAFFAASQDGIIPRRQGLDWLLADECWWLWSPETLREAMRLLVALAPELEEDELRELEEAILGGPPRVMYRDDIEPKAWVRIQENDIWLRLAKFAGTGARLSVAGAERMDEIAAKYPEWRILENERDEFSTWVGDWSEGREFVMTPREPGELIEWVRENADNDPWQRDDWVERCREDFDASASALSDLAMQDIWPRRRWREALQAWSEGGLIERSWGAIASVLAQAPDESLQTLSHGVSFWLRAVAKTFEGQEEAFLALCDRVLKLKYEEEDDSDDVVGRAINHPVGQVTEALLHWWYRGPLEDDQGLGGDLNPRFSRICDTRIVKFRHGRVLLAAHVIALFRVDCDWATRCMLPLFEWERSVAEARSAWEGFLWSPRLYRPLMEALKPAFLETAHHYAELGRHDVQYSSLLTFAALDPGGIFTRRELATATAALSQEGLNNSANTLVRAIDGAGAQGTDYWRNRVAPYLRTIWPKTHDVASASIAESFALACISAKDAFPEALDQVRPWLEGLAFPERTVHRLHEAKIHERFPRATLNFLHLVIGDGVHWPPNDLAACLEAIRAAEPELEGDHRFQRLAEILRAHAHALN